MENDQTPKKLSPSEVFRLWADKIDKNSPEDFAGAFVIITPSGETISSLLIDKEKDVGNFFALVKTKIDSALDVINEQQKINRGFR